MKLLLVTLSFALAATVLSRVAAGQTPASRGLPGIAYISPQQILTKSPVFQAGLSKLQSVQQQKTAELREKQQSVETIRRRLAVAGDEAARADLQRIEQQQVADLERATTQAQTDLQTLQRQFQSDLQAKIRPIVEDLARDQKLQLVLSADGAVFWAAAGMDLTPAVLERLNAASPAAPR
jgi:Skp family chaperone for outer membrane proteins